MHDASPLADNTLAAIELRSRTGANIVGRWLDEELRSPPGPDEIIRPGTILVAAGTPESIEKLSEMARQITEEGTIVVIGFGKVGRKVGRSRRLSRPCVRTYASSIPSTGRAFTSWATSLIARCSISCPSPERV